MVDNYQDRDLDKLEFPENIRKRPGMYMGDTQDGSALHHMVYEVLDNSVDEFLEGHCKNIWVTLHSSTDIRIRDDGRGIPTSFNEKEKKTNLELALEDLHAGGKFSGENYKRSGGLHGVGIKAVNALSSHVVVRVYKDTEVVTVGYAFGKQNYPVTKEVNKSGYKRGTAFSFTPDDTIFTNITTFDPKTIIQRLKQTAYLNSGLKIIYEDSTGIQEFYFENGLLNFIQDIDKSKAIADPILVVDSVPEVDLKLALKWNDTTSELFQCFTNNTYQRDGGTHLTAVRTSLTKVLLPFFKEDKIEVISDDIRDGLTYIISIYISEPKFNSQTKDKLVNSDISSPLNSLIQENLKKFFEKNKFQTQKILDKIRLNAKAREASRKAKENVVKSGSNIATGKLKECSETDPRLIELILVEGDSAGGTAKMARNRKFQAILPLRGKILNVEKASSEKVQASKEINILKSVIGDFPNYNYHKVIILTDADVDGSHISTLLLTLFYRRMPDLIEQGYVYMGRPPLSKAMVGKKANYLLNEKALSDFQKSHKVTKLSRFKGLGEMNPEELWDTTLNPVTRTLARVTITDALAAEDVFRMIMSSEVEPRKNFIIESDRWKNLQLDI